MTFPSQDSSGLYGAKGANETVYLLNRVAAFEFRRIINPIQSLQGEEAFAVMKR